MTSPTEKPVPVFYHEFPVPESAIDENSHVNNVVYVQWMQDVAVMHAEANGGTAIMRECGATWVARSHNIEYLRPAVADDEIIAQTWVMNLKRVKSTRRYRFVRRSDNTLLARGETQWVFVDAKTGRPRSIPDQLIARFPLLDSPDA